MHPALIYAPAGGFPFGETVLCREQDDVAIDFSVVRQRAGEVIDQLDDKECAWLLVDGRAQVAAGELRALLSRASLFDERPSVVHACADTAVRLHAESDVEWLRVRASNGQAFAPRVFLPA